MTNFFFLFLLSGLMLIYSNNNEMFIEVKLFQMKNMLMSIIVVVDFTSMMFMNTVLLISASVIIYSMNYMSMEKFNSQFNLMVVVFILSMLMLIVSPNLFSILLGWDGLGVSSFLLVNYYSSEKSFNASFLTVTTNRIGDSLIILTIACLYPTLSNNFFIYSYSNLTSMILLLLITGAMTKSAMIPFSSWLPAAMAAPTPVSSLVHSSTLVTAGVYLIIRMNYMLTGEMKTLILLFGSMTMIMASVSAIGEMDIKKVVALTTLTNLGVMFVALGLDMVFLSMIHLVSHAYFKAMIFMSVGIYIHSSKDYQDSRTISCSNYMPINSSILLCGVWSSMSAPFFCSFYSKDYLLEAFLMKDINMFCLVMFGVLILASLKYSSKIIMVIASKKMVQGVMNKELDTNFSEMISMILLFFFSIAGGWAMTGNYSALSPIFLPLLMKVFSMTILLSFMFYLVMFESKIESKNKHAKGFSYMWFLPVNLSNKVTKASLLLSKSMSLNMDKSFTNQFFNLMINFQTNFMAGKNLFKVVITSYLIFFIMMII